ncbi:MAG: tRNA (adenosine(37)-N6)-threonylcarbamoyltransferase complex ATPase subunit type 1 TsaE [Deltaproteobacteria bacterium]|nr:tRNA (adenosine(37)-N6)-threonylcarbamoyltransferase complex ATPase subunit type 1 TsaE [Deltaproteobacteria bacterium]
MAPLNDQLCPDANAMIELGRAWAKKMWGGERIGLVGALGAGKTTFAKGFIAELTGLHPDEIQSPTFTLVQSYATRRDCFTIMGPCLRRDDTGRNDIYHLDLYRLNSLVEFENLGLDEFFTPSNIILIEWADKFLEVQKLCTQIFKFKRGLGSTVHFATSHE